MASSAPSEAPRPFVETSVARLLRSRIQAIHDERAITVISGPWGIGKTTAIDAFARENEFGCAVVKVEPGSSKRGATPIAVMQLAIQAVELLNERSARATCDYGYYKLRHLLHDTITEMFDIGRPGDDDSHIPSFTFIFDEAQYLSREAIEMLRYWNDSDRGVTPFPVGLVFVGNNEFALQEDRNGQSVISGAVRSRALLIEALEYEQVSDLDLTLFLQSREIRDGAAIQAVLAHFGGRKPKRDLRAADRLISALRRRAGDGPVTAAIVRSLLDP